MRWHASRLVCGAAVLAAFATVCPPAVAMNWQITPKASSSVTYTDNVNLAPSGQEESDTVFQVRPGVHVEGNGPRTNVNLDYSLQALYHARNSGTQVNHQISGHANSELVKRTMFVDASLSRRQELASLGGPIGVDNTTSTGNQNTVTTVSISPYFKNRLGSFADSTLRFTHDRVYEETGGDSYSDSANWDLASGPSFQRVFWSTNARYARIEGEGNDSGTFRSGSGRLGYKLGRHLQVSGTGGYESNDYVSSSNDLSGSFWDVGFDWAPNQRTNVEARYGHRYFGKTRTLRISHHRKHTVTSVSYTETITSSRQDLLVPVNRIPVYRGCSPANDPSCQPVGEVVIYGVEPVNEFYVEHRGIGTVTLIGNRNSVTFAAYRTEKDFQVSNRTETQTGATGNWTWDVGVRSSLSFNAGWSRNRFSVTSRRDTLYNASVSFSHDLGPRVSTHATLRHQQRNSDDSAAEYSENAVTLGLSATY